MPTPSEVDKTTALLQSSMKTWFLKMRATQDPAITAGLQVLASAPTFEESANLLYGFFDRQAMHAVKDADEMMDKLWPLLAYYALDMIDWESLTKWVLTEQRNQEFAEVGEVLSAR